MRSKKSAVLIPVLALTIALGGCGQEVVLDGTETAATLDGTTNMTLGEFNLLLRYQEAQMETYYGSMFGTSNIYAQDMTGSGTIYGETAKESLIEQFREMYVLEAEAPNYGVELTDEEKSAITEAAAKFLEDNTEEVKNDLGVDQNSVERFLTLATIQDKMYDALTADVDTEVSDEEAAQKRIAYVYISASGTETDENGNTIDLTDEEKEAIKEELQAILDSAAESGDLNAAVDEANESRDEDNQLSVSEITYGADSTTPVEEVRNAADALADGEVSSVVETDTGYYGIQMVSTFDEEATQTEKENIIQERRDTLYQEQCDALVEQHTFETVDSALDKLNFNRVYYLDTTAGTETDTSTESETDTGAESESEEDAEAAADSETAADAESGTEAESETDAAAE